MKKTLITVVGPTAIGKTNLSLSLAAHYNTVILSADSRQFYKEMSIGTAVPEKNELAQVPHYFIQHKSVVDSYSVGDFEKDALTLLKTLFKTKNTVVMVGGSGLYIDAVIRGLDVFPKVDPFIREQLNELFNKEGLVAIQKKLYHLDKEHYKNIDLENPHRIIRALEVCIGSGKPYSSFLNKPKIPRDFETLTVGLTAERSLIYNRIEHRVDMMLEKGILAEAKSLIPYKNLNALQTVGYKELFEYLNGNWTLAYAVSEIKKNTRRFAKRQLTWFSKNTATLWFPHDENVKIIIQELDKTLMASTNESTTE